MQPYISSPQHVRNSYGYTFHDSYLSKTPQAKGFPTHSNYFPSQPYNDKLTSSIRNIDNKADLIESPSRKKLGLG
jgi:hypothetical protein